MWDHLKLDRDQGTQPPQAARDLRDAMEYNPDSAHNFADISRILAFRALNYREDYIWIVEFTDGTRSLFLGWEDSTGWDCRSSLTRFPVEGWKAFPAEGWETRIREHTFYGYNGRTEWDGEAQKHLDMSTEDVIADLRAQLAAHVVPST